MSVRILQGDSLTVLRTLESESVQCVVTSPPFFALRSYLPADHPDKDQEIGSEPTPDAFVATMVTVFREVRRVLRRDGICVVNLGDSYSGSGRGPGNKINGNLDQDTRQGFHSPGGQTWPGLPAKNLMMIPFSVAMAMQADGWVLRSVMPWVKRNSMPESVQDRPASAIEYLFLFARSPRYFWDAEAIRVPALLTGGGTIPTPDKAARAGQTTNGTGLTTLRSKDIVGRSYRNSDPFFATWQGLMLDEDDAPMALVVNPQPSKLSHFASYPAALVEPFVRAGTSQKGACPACGAPWVRCVVRGENPYPGSSHDHTADLVGTGAQRHESGLPAGTIMAKRWQERQSPQTTGWAPGCSCDAGDPVPCVVLDPFLGSGTTAMVADRLQRDAVGIELSPTYVAMARRRLEQDAGPMFADTVTVA